MFGRYEAEIKHLKGVISQFESGINQMKFLELISQELIKKTNGFEEQLRKFEEEKARIIKDCDDSLMQEFEKRMKLQERFKDLEAQVDRFQAEKEVLIPDRPKGESYGKDYDISLQKGRKSMRT